MNLLTSLMQHQRSAFDKLKNIKISALFMDMGTGKTRTALEFIRKRITEGKIDTVLWLCPVSAKQNIAREIEKHSTASHELVGNTIKKIADIHICGIETLSSSKKAQLDLYNYCCKNRVFVIVDESTLIKNTYANRTRSMQRIGEQCEYKMILNGTPITKNYADLFAQLYFLSPKILGYYSFHSFSANHLEYDERYKGRIVRAHNTEFLSYKMNPFTYQVMKDECLDLPPKTYSVRMFEMNKKQLRLYSHIKDYYLNVVPVEQIDRYIYAMFTALQRCVSGYDNQGKKNIFKNPMDNPRINVLLGLLEEIGENKVIIWYKYHNELEDIKRALCESSGNKDCFVGFHGGMDQSKRNESVVRFQTDTSVKYFVANQQCGGYSLNLQACSYAVYYSNSFNYATRKQSEDRIHRIGQSKNVHIIDILCSESIDMVIDDNIHSKQNVLQSFKEKLNEVRDNKEKLRKLWGGM